MRDRADVKKAAEGKKPPVKVNPSTEQQIARAVNAMREASKRGIMERVFKQFDE